MSERAGESLRVAIQRALKKPQVAGRICLGIVVIIVSIRTWGRLVFTPGHLPTPDAMGDYFINVSAAENIFQQCQYPQGFVHPLPTVVLWHSLNCCGFVPGAILWLAVMMASMLGSLCLSRPVAFSRAIPFAGLAVGLAFAAVEYYLLWDLSHANFNSLFLILALLGVWCLQYKRPVWAGALIGASAALKLYSIAFLPYLFLRKESRAGLSMVFFLAVFFVGVPICFFGMHEAVSLNGQWLGIMGTTFSKGYVYPAYKVSLSWVVSVLLSPEASDGRLNILNCSAAEIAWVVRSLSLGWLALIAGYFTHTSLTRQEPAADNRMLARSLDCAVLLLCLLPLSSSLQPHHLVVLLFPATVLTLAMMDGALPGRVRAAGGFTVVAGAFLTEISPSYPLRGIGVMLTLLAYLSGIWIVRCGLGRPPRHGGDVPSA